MKRLLRATFASSVAAALLLAHTASTAEPNTLTAAEQKAGWRLLFDGKSTDGWRNFKKPALTEAGWVVEDGCLKKVANVRGGDLITVDQFTDFEFSWEWKLPPRANNGVKYFITEERAGPIGHEYQMIDDSVVKTPFDSTASFYLVVPPREDKPLKAPGQWNHSRILVQGNHVEHWLNGQKVLEYECGDPQLLAQVQQTKFKKVEGFGTKIKGHLLLTDHKDECWFRNLKIRELPAP
jgi:hypothetical protein